MTETEIAEAYARYGHLVLRRCRKILRHGDAADDAMQETYVRLWKYGDSYRDAASKVAWLYRVADRCCFDALARQKSRRETTLDTEGFDPPVAGGAKDVEARDVVLRFLDRFDDDVKEVAVLFYLDELTQEEIATALGCSRPTVAKRLAYIEERANQLRGAWLGEDKVAL